MIKKYNKSKIKNIQIIDGRKNLELIKKINKDFLINQKSDIFICLILLLIVSLTTAIYPFLIQKVFDNLTENKFSWFFLPTIIALVASIRGIAMFFQIKQVSKVTLKVSIDIQKKLSNHLLFSDLDMIKKISSGKGLIVLGQGSGHGVGMSQWGAKYLASRGQKAERILKHFYRGVQIKPFRENYL